MNGVDDSVAKLWTNVQFRNAVMTIAQEIEDEFKSKVEAETGQVTRFASFRDFTSTTETYERFIEHKVILDFLSEHGTHHFPIEIHHLPDHDALEHELNSHRQLFNELKNMKGVKVQRLLAHSETGSFSVYDGMRQYTALSDFEETWVRSFMRGKAAAATHSTEISSGDLDRTEIRFLHFLGTLPFSDEHREELMSLVAADFAEIVEMQCTTTALSSFSAVDLRVSEKEILSGTTKHRIENGDAFNLIIPMRPPPKVTINRMNDVAGSLLHSYAEYQRENKLHKCLQDALHILRGYEAGLLIKTGKRLNELFPTRLHLDLHVVLQVWNQQINAEADGMKVQDSDALFAFAEHLLKRRPFEKIAATLTRRSVL